MSSRSKRESRGSTRGKRESESRGSSGRVKRDREPEAASTRGSPVRVKREVEPGSVREAPAPAVPAVRVKREREADEDSEPEREVRGARGRATFTSYIFFKPFSNFPVLPAWGWWERNGIHRY
jgi:U4/U6.U5 tri-snRNP-associated protein 2